MKNIIFAVAIAFFVASCSNDEPTHEDNRPPTLRFDPEIDRYEGKPGDKLNLKIIIEGESGFTRLETQKKVNNIQEGSEIIIDTDQKSVFTPYEHDFEYELNENETGKTVNLTFTVSYKERTPSGGMVINFQHKALQIVTIEGN